MQDLLPLAERIAARLKQRNETIAVAESSTGGLVSAALLAMPGASAYFVAGAVIYTRQARAGLLGIAEPLPGGIRPATEDYAALLAEAIRQRCGASWGIGESGAAGPSGNRYGDPSGHSCIAVHGGTPHAITVRTGSVDRLANMRTFARAALDLLASRLDAG